MKTACADGLEATLFGAHLSSRFPLTAVVLNVWLHPEVHRPPALKYALAAGGTAIAALALLLCRGRFSHRSCFG